MSLRAIIFDIDGVLADNIAYEEKNLEYILDELVDKEGISYVEAQDRLDAIALKYRGTRQAHDWRTLTKELNLGNVWYDAHIANLKYLSEIPEITELLESLSKQVKLYVGTDAIRPVAEIKLAYLGLKRFFEKIFTQDDLDAFKGTPDFFDKIAKNLRLKHSEMLYVGNRPERGIRTAKKAGLKTILIPHPEHLQIKEKIPADVEPDLETKDLAEVRTFIFKLIKRK